MSKAFDIISAEGDGRFGIYGGKFVPETLIPCLKELEDCYREACNDPAFPRSSTDPSNPAARSIPSALK